MATSLVNAGLLFLTAPDYLTEEQVIVLENGAPMPEPPALNFKHRVKLFTSSNKMNMKFSLGRIIIKTLLYIPLLVLLHDVVIVFIYLCGGSVDTNYEEFRHGDCYLSAEKVSAPILFEFYKIKREQKNGWYIKFEIPGTMDGNFLLSIISRNKIMKQNSTREIVGSCYVELVETLDTQYIKIW